MPRTRGFPLAVALFAAAALTACGGGGGSTPAAAPDPGVSFSSTNMVSAAKVANDGFVLFDMALFAAQPVLWGNGWFVNGASNNCQQGAAAATGGTLKVSSTNAGGKAKVGETLTMVYDNCLLSDNQRASGSIAITLTSVTGDPTTLELNKPWAFAGNASYGNFTLVSGANRDSYNGNYQITMDSAGVVTASGLERINTKFTSAAFTVKEDANTNNYNAASGALFQDYATQQPWTAIIASSVQSSLFNGVMRFETGATFTGGFVSPTPSAGTGKMFGASGHSIDMQANANGVNLSMVTPAGTGAQSLTWTQFLAK